MEGTSQLLLRRSLCQTTAVLVVVLSGSNSSPRSSDREDHFPRPPVLSLVFWEREDVQSPSRRSYWLLSHRCRQAFCGFVVRSAGAPESSRQESSIDSRGPQAPIPHRNRRELVATRCDYL